MNLHILFPRGRGEAHVMVLASRAGFAHALMQRPAKALTIVGLTPAGHLTPAGVLRTTTNRFLLASPGMTRPHLTVCGQASAGT